jgi:acetylornithine deacetylase
MSELHSELSPSLKLPLSQLLEFDTTTRESNLELIENIRQYLSNLGITSTLVFNDKRTKANLYA